jgi:serine/threonine protein kinase
MTTWGLNHGDEIVPGRHAVLPLGGGYRYEAYLAWDDHLRALVVAKLLRPSRASDPDALRALAAEAELLRTLAHPLLVRSFGATLEGERPHIVLEHVEGPRLSTLVRRYGMALEQILTLGLSLSSVLCYLRAERVVHLDVKPRNIIMDGAPRLIDLSVARRAHELGQIRSPVGTDAYMAPEQCDPARFTEIGAPSDVWGLGVTLYEALSQRLPFPEGPGRFPQLSADPRPLSKEVPEVLGALVMSCLERRPADRPTAELLADALEPLVDALPAPKIGPFRPGGRRLMRELELR